MHFFRQFLLVSLLLCAGCSNLEIPSYGHVAPDRESFSPEINKAILPDGAPSISQGFKPDTNTISTNVGGSGTHEGIDIIHNIGTPVLAAAGGTVESSSSGLLFGNQVVVNHGLSRDGLHYKTFYGHLEHRLVKEGDILQRGQQLGTLGKTGLLAGNFAHLHFEVRTAVTSQQSSTRAVHPHKYWFDGKGVVTCFDIERGFSGDPFKTTYPVPCASIRWKAWEQDR